MPILILQEVACENVDLGLARSLREADDGFHLSALEHYFYKQQYQEAYKYLEKMKKKSIIVTPYLDPQIVEDIYKGVGIAMPQSKQEDDDGIEEDIQQDF
jgi:hypothetical protein